MFEPRQIESRPDWLNQDSVKLYTISARHQPVTQAPYRAQLESLKAKHPIPWATTAAFAIFHDGATAQYLVLAWWGNDNELFTKVSVNTHKSWMEDPSRYSFCLWDLTVMWFERNCFMEFVYCSKPDLAAYRERRM